jgi:ABC-type transport system substrate-binding protein
MLLFPALASAFNLPVLNNPHAAEAPGQKVLYSVFSSPPKHLDPVNTYNLDDSVFIDQIYEPPLEYHYLKRPFQLQPLTLVKMPGLQFLDASGQVTSTADSHTVYSRYVFDIKPGIRYQPHPAFAKNAKGESYYQFHSVVESKGFRKLADFTQTGTRELTANDYVYEIKRMADPTLQMPIWDLLSHYIVGLAELREDIQLRQKQYPGQWINLDDCPISGVKEEGKYRFSITLHGVYPQFKYWLAFHFFAPVPMEVDRFYHLPGLAEKNITLDFYPVGTGPYRMTKQDVNEEIVLERNPNYHDDFYPAEGEAADEKNGLLGDAGKKLPFIDKVSFRMETEAIPVWTKFLQGYYDRSGISSDSFDQAVNVTVGGIALSDDMQKKGIQLSSSVEPATYYLGFNMLDATVGGLDERHRKLRQAIAIAFDEQEQISIFRNGRGEVAMSPLPPGVWGYQSGQEGINPDVFNWNPQAANGAGQAERKSIAEAKQLLAEAGYPDGRDATTGAPLVLNLDTTTGGTTDNSRNTWLAKQFQKINIQLNIRATDYNRFQEKMEKGNDQIYFWGWFADYPDPENFLFLLYGPNGRVGSGGAGVNSSNYNNPAYNALFDQMKNMEDTPERLAIIRQMIAIFQHDLPWASAFHPQTFVLDQAWLHNYKPHGISKSTLKYQNLDASLREDKRHEWNQPVLWPLALLVLLLLVIVVPGFRAYRHRMQRRIIVPAELHDRKEK